MLLTKINNELKYIDNGYILLLLIPTLMVFAYGKYRCDNIVKHKDILEFGLFKNSDKFGLDGWSITHFSLFFIVGFFYSKVFVITMLLGIFWELFETYVGIYKPEIIKGLGFCELSANKYKVWWYGKLSDPLANFLGFVLGMTLHNYLK